MLLMTNVLTSSTIVLPIIIFYIEISQSLGAVCSLQSAAASRYAPLIFTRSTRTDGQASSHRSVR